MNVFNLKKENTNKSIKVFGGKFSSFYTKLRAALTICCISLSYSCCSNTNEKSYLKATNEFFYVGSDEKFSFQLAANADM